MAISITVYHRDMVRGPTVIQGIFFLMKLDRLVSRGENLHISGPHRVSKTRENLHISVVSQVGGAKWLASAP